MNKSTNESVFIPVVHSADLFNAPGSDVQSYNKPQRIPKTKTPSTIKLFPYVPNKLAVYSVVQAIFGGRVIWLRSQNNIRHNKIPCIVHTTLSGPMEIKSISLLEYAIICALMDTRGETRLKVIDILLRKGCFEAGDATLQFHTAMHYGYRCDGINETHRAPIVRMLIEYEIACKVSDFDCSNQSLIEDHVQYECLCPLFEYVSCWVSDKLRTRVYGKIFAHGSSTWRVLFNYACDAWGPIQDTENVNKILRNVIYELRPQSRGMVGDILHRFDLDPSRSGVLEILDAMDIEDVERDDNARYKIKDVSFTDTDFQRRLYKIEELEKTRRIHLADVKRAIENRDPVKRNLAVSMGLHSRLGSGSAIRMLDDGLLRMITSMVSE
jgi:hypothetical protein